MIAPSKKMLAILLLLFFCPLLPRAQAAETPYPTPSAASAATAGGAQETGGTFQPPQQLVLSLGQAVAMAAYRNIDLRVEALNFKMAETDTAKSWGIYNPVLNATGTGGVTGIPGDPFFASRTWNASVGLTQSLPIGGNIGATTQTGYFKANPSSPAEINTVPTGSNTSGAGTNTAVPATTNWQSAAGLTLTLPLLKNAGRETVELNITLAANTQQDSLERFRATTMETVSNVITSYNHLYVLRQALETRVAALTSAQKLLDEIRKKAATGPVQGMELANAEFAIAQRRKDLVEASRSVSDQEVSLRYLIGLDQQTPIIPSDPPSRDEPQETDQQAARAALEFRSDLKQLQLSLKSAQLQERVARRQSWPDLSANAGGGYTGSGSSFGDSYKQIGDHSGTYWNVGMQFTVPLGNTAAVNDYRKNRIRTEQVQDQIRALSWKIRNDVGSDMRALISARLQVQLSDKATQLAEQRLEEYRKNNQAGSATIQDVLNAENDRNTARNAQLEAAETFSNAVTKLWKDTGLLLNRHGIHIDTSHPDKLTENKEQNPSLLVDSSASGGPAASPPPAAGQEQTRNRAAAPAPPVAAAPALVAKKPTTVDMEKASPATQPTTTVAHHMFTISIGEYGERSAMTDAIEKIKRAGLTPLVKQGPIKTETVHLLFVTDYEGEKAAQQEVDRLHSVYADGFFVKGKEGKFTVYAGSYRDRKQAVMEQKRLAAHGIESYLKNDTVSLPTYVLTVGSFASPQEAEKPAKILEKQGLKAAVTESAE
jgi:outer membrane protein